MLSGAPEGAGISMDMRLMRGRNDIAACSFLRTLFRLIAYVVCNLRPASHRAHTTWLTEELPDRKMCDSAPCDNAGPAHFSARTVFVIILYAVGRRYQIPVAVANTPSRQSRGGIGDFATVSLCSLGFAPSAPLREMFRIAALRS